MSFDDAEDLASRKRPPRRSERNTGEKMNGIPTSDCVIRHMLSSFLAEASSFSVFLTSSSSWETRIF